MAIKQSTIKSIHPGHAIDAVVPNTLPYPCQVGQMRQGPVSDGAAHLHSFIVCDRCMATDNRYGRRSCCGI